MRNSGIRVDEVTFMPPLAARSLLSTMLEYTKGKEWSSRLKQREIAEFFLVTRNGPAALRNQLGGLLVDGRLGSSNLVHSEVLERPRLLDVLERVLQVLELEVDLGKQEVRRVGRADGATAVSFATEASRRDMLLTGVDEIGQTLQLEEHIDVFEQKRAGSQPWLGGFKKKRVDIPTGASSGSTDW